MVTVRACGRASGTLCSIPATVPRQQHRPRRTQGNVLESRRCCALAQHCKRDGWAGRHRQLHHRAQRRRAAGRRCRHKLQGVASGALQAVADAGKLEGVFDGGLVLHCQHQLRTRRQARALRLGRAAAASVRLALRVGVLVLPRLALEAFATALGRPAARRLLLLAAAASGSRRRHRAVSGQAPQSLRHHKALVGKGRFGDVLAAAIEHRG